GIGVRTLDSVYADELAGPRATAALGSTFAAIALVAAAGGLFSVLSYAVGRRRREFGIRAALGASPAGIARVVLHDAAVVSITGIAIGAAAAWLLSRALASLQYGVTIADPATWAGVIATLIAATAAATWWPARSAMRTDPLMLLREE